MSVCATTISSTRCIDAAVAAAIARLANRTLWLIQSQTSPTSIPWRDVVLVCVKDCTQQEATTRMQRLIEANQEVRQTFGKHLTAEAGVIDKA